MSVISARRQAADAHARRVIFVTEGRDAKTIEVLVADLYESFWCDD